MDELQDLFRRVFDECAARGTELPFIVCTVAANDAIYAIRAHGDGATPADVLVERFKPEGMRLPINIMVVGRNNTAARVVIEADDQGEVRTSYH